MNKWYINDAIYYGDAVINRELVQGIIVRAVEHSPIDKKRLKDVMYECLQIIDYIGKRIGEVELIKYEAENSDEKWKYKEFGANEYQIDLFFIRNRDNIKLIFNVIKKGDKKMMADRC
jgi:hypothetical protein